MHPAPGSVETAEIALVAEIRQGAIVKRIDFGGLEKRRREIALRDQ